ncbi:MAG: hypothetical protein DMF84_28705 [Acidobacteria bacterium]|nr:MAG: hypothetical protein DMF84_28705 [Acidobacteriota bacterium]
MKRFVVTRLVLIAAFAVTALAQDAPPKEPFKTVHLVNITSPADVAAMQETIADLNAVVAKAGYSDTRYRLFKVTGTQAGTYNYLLESSWPGGEAYDQVHRSPEWLAAAQKHPDFPRITKDQVYNRYVEVLPTKR